jgi:hypothetical protein
MDVIKREMVVLLPDLARRITGRQDVGRVAEQCQAKTLVLSHIGPGNTPVSRLKEARKNFSGRLIIGEDLMEIGVGRAQRRSRG